MRSCIFIGINGIYTVCILRAVKLCQKCDETMKNWGV